jgi:CheY-like chemotaxis protein
MSAHLADSPTESLRALLIEDNEADRDLFRATFRQCGPKNVLDHAGSGEEAMAWVQENRGLPDVIFVDLRLPGMSGFDVLSWIRSDRELGATFVVAISGGFPVTDVTARNVGADALLLKPIGPVEMRGIMAVADEFRRRRSIGRSPFPSSRISSDIHSDAPFPTARS